MSEIIPNVVVSMPSQQFTLARKFQAASNGKIYIGKIDTDPTIPSNQIQVYLENEDGSTIPVSQPLIIDVGGYPVYNGQIAKFVTVEGHSMAVYDSYGVQQFYYPNVLKYDPDRFRSEIGMENGVSLVGGAVYRIKTVDTMRNISFQPRDGDICITSGYSHVFDGGGAEYAYSMSSTTATDGFLVHDCVHGGKWLLIDNRSRLPFQVAGAKIDGVTDDRSAFISVLKAKRPMSLSRGEMLISGHINLDDFNEQQWAGVDIEGVGLYSEIVFADGAGGFSTTNDFTRCLTLRNIRVKNKLMDKSGVGFQCPRGAEQILWENVTFSGWKLGYDVHAWNSSFANVTSRDCEYSGCFSGTSLEINSLYALRCDNGHMLGFRYNKTTGDVGISPQALSYVKVGAMAADHCLTPYAFGFCQNVELVSIGAEEYLGDCILDFSRIPTNRARQNIVIGSLDVYIESKHDELISIVKEPSYTDGAYGSVTIKDTRIWSDRNIPFFDNSGTGFVTENILYNRSLTKSEANGVKAETPITIGEKNGLRLSLGTIIGPYSSMRNVKSILQVKTGGKLVFRLHEVSAGGLGAGICCFGDIGIYPAHISGNNANRDCGSLKIATSADYANGLSQLNSQKIGTLTNVTVASRVNNGVYEIVISLNQPVVYMLTLDVWKNGNFLSSFSDYYIE
ncbi:phage head-binding domain-containing protein [Providencia rettgeri]|uniref:phage head-binding domain-containing protein n=1 Tax=Providencia rettgeri TaxID=587 RepID=UPI003017FEF8